jgi:hypothetical protein
LALRFLARFSRIHGYPSQLFGGRGRQEIHRPEPEIFYFPQRPGARAPFQVNQNILQVLESLRRRTAAGARPIAIDFRERSDDEIYNVWRELSGIGGMLCR